MTNQETQGARGAVKHIVQFSGGVGSWMAAMRVANQHGTDNMILLFADTKMEDEDLYRFLDEAAANVGAPLVRITDGRTPWELFKDKKFIGNHLVDKCSEHLKRNLLRKWRNENCGPKNTTVYLGIDWTEEHRLTRLRTKPEAKKWNFQAPLCDAPYLSKAQMIEALKAEGIRPPRLYELGFPHNNCGGFCVKAGQAQFALLLQTMPERYRWHEEQEEAMRQYIGKDVSVMRDRRGGKSRPLTMRAFRERIEAGQLFDKEEWGGCGCAID